MVVIYAPPLPIVMFECIICTMNICDIHKCALNATAGGTSAQRPGDHYSRRRADNVIRKQKTVQSVITGVCFKDNPQDESANNFTTTMRSCRGPGIPAIASNANAKTKSASEENRRCDP